MAHWPRHFAAGVEGAAHAEMQGRAIKCGWLLNQRHIVNPCRRRRGWIVIRDEVPLHPLAQIVIKGRCDGESTTRDRWSVVTAERVAINWWPGKRLKRGRAGIAETVENLAAEFAVRVIG